MRVLAVLLTTAAAAAQTYWPPPPTPAGNPTTPQKALLGKALFWDEQLSSSRTIACGTCHVFETGGADPRSLNARHPGADSLFGTPDDIGGSPGIARQDALGNRIADPVFGIRAQVTGRRAPTVINAAYQPELFWDGRAGGTFRDPVSNAVLLPAGGALESQIAGPPVSDVEMSHIGRSWVDIANDLPARTPLALADQIPPALQTFVAGQTYASLFAQVYGSPGVTPERIIFAIAAYERTLIADQSPYDRFLNGQPTLNQAELAGLLAFDGLCATCHTDVDITVTMNGPVGIDYRNIGVRPLSEDMGRFNVTQNPLDAGKFKVNNLRNVALRAPFFHNGRETTIGGVVDFYARGGDFGLNQDTLIPSMVGQIDTATRNNLVAFLSTLTDPRVPAGLPPFDRPRLWSEGPRAPVHYGTGTGSPGRVPAAVIESVPYLGNPKFSIGVDRAAPGAFHVLCYDLVGNPAGSTVNGLGVYLGLSSALVVVPMPTPTQGAGNDGYASVTFPIPNQQALGGTTFFGQWLIVDPLGPGGLSVSNGFSITLF